MEEEIAAFAAWSSVESASHIHHVLVLLWPKSNALLSNIIALPFRTPSTQFLFG
jgi:hypothetical protein